MHCVWVAALLLTVWTAGLASGSPLGESQSLEVAERVLQAPHRPMGPRRPVRLASPQVQTTNGPIVGRAAPFPFDYDTNVYRGIPFGQSTAGSNRFAPPLPALKWTNPLDATQFGPDCYVENSGMSSSPAGISEDCLYLNVYQPSGCQPGDKLPVIVYYYGGGFGMGSGSFPVYNGASIIGSGEENVVIATVNYRLGSLGFLASDKLRKLSKNNSTGNMGLLDQRLATQWIRANAEAFCGDPNSITAWGESAGAASISNHLVMPNSKGLFDRAILDSGPMATWIADPQDEANTQFEAAAASVGCSASQTNDQVACLQKVPAYNMVRCQWQSGRQTRFTPWAPTVDGVELPDVPWALAEAGKMHPVPILLGSNLNEGTLLIGFAHINAPHDMTPEQYLEFGNTFFGNGTMGQGVQELYPVTDFSSPWWGVVQVLTDNAMACPARRMARWAEKVNATAYLYEFNHEIDVAQLDEWLGVFHGDDLAFTWMLRWWYLSWKEGEDIAIPAGELFTPDERALQETATHWWMQFARTGNPNYPGQPTPQWPIAKTDWTANKTPRMDITIEPAPIPDWRNKYCDFWDQWRNWR